MSTLQRKSWRIPSLLTLGLALGLSPTLASAQSAYFYYYRPTLDVGLPQTPRATTPPTAQPKCTEPEAALLSKSVEAPAQAAAQALSSSTDIAGQCVPTSSNLAEDVASATRARAMKSPALHIKKENGQPATAEDWVAVDLIARTLFGEIAGADECTDTYAYVKAVGKVIMNRADYMTQEDRDKHTRFSKTDTSVKNPVARVAIENSQFQAWGYKKTPPNFEMRCPSDAIQKINRDKNGKAISSTSQGAYLRWFLALEVATDMIFKEKSFRCSTKQVNSLFYAKGNENPIPHGTQDKSATIDKVKINNPRCAQIWDSPNAKLKPQKLNCP